MPPHSPPDPVFAVARPLAAARILVVDDDRKLAALLVDLFAAHGMSASAVHDGVAGIERAREETWDLVVLDVMLPYRDGFSVLHELRAASNVPVLMLTARGGEADLVSGFERGADDYVPKTASSRELIVRVQALLRRASIPVAQTAAPPPPIVVGSLVIDGERRSVLVDGAPVELTPVEFDLLWTLARARGRVRSREELVREVRRRAFDALDRSIDVHVASLRRKLGDDPRRPRFIRTMRSAGYLLVDPDTPAS